MRTVEKYIVAPRVLPNGPTLARGKEPITSLIELFQLRNALAHPKPEIRSPSTETFPDEPHGYDRLNPEVAARMLVAVAAAASRLTAWPAGTRPDTAAALYYEGRATVKAFGNRARAGFPSGSGVEPSLLVQIIQSDQARRKRASRRRQPNG